MADYYPLLSKAVAGLPNSTPESRRAIYDRAAKALIGQLQQLQPPVPKADVDRETKALEDAIARIEAEKSSATLEANLVSALDAALKTSLPPAKPATPPSPMVQRAPSVSVRPAAQSGDAATPAVTPAPVAERPDPQRAPVQPVPPQAQAHLPDADAGLAARPRGKSRALLYSGLGLVFLALAAGVGYYAWKNKLTPAQFGQPRQSENVPSAPPVQPPAQPPRQADRRFDDRVPPNGTPEPAREVAPERPPVRTAAEPDAPAQPRAEQPPVVQPQPDSSQSAAVPVAQRAAILIAEPSRDNPNNVQTFIGSTVWRTETVNRGGGQPVTQAVRADIDIPDAKFSAILTIEKNFDATLPASHTFTWRFQRGADSPIPEILETDSIQMRDETQPNVDPLLGARARITANIFIVALATGDTIAKRNIELLSTKGWIDLPMRTADNRLAKITIEKGSPGEKIFQEALAAWGP